MYFLERGWEKLGMPDPHSIRHHFRLLEDPRIERGRRHSLHDILLLGLCAVLCGAESFVDMEDFGKAQRDWLSEWLELPNGIPSHDTFGRVFAALDPAQFAEAFSAWTQSLRQSLPGEIVAVDGKTLRRSGGSGQSPVHLVSAWAVGHRLVLGQLRTAEKSNEITAVPELLRRLELAGCIVTLDAMGCQKTIAREIHEADADYVLALKANHEVLHAEIQSFLDDALDHPAHLPAASRHQSVEKDHGRIETRRCLCSDQLGWLADRGQWSALRSVAVVEAERTLGERTTRERRYYLSSLPPDALELARAIRGHWGIENSLHWVLDVALREDDCRVRTGHAATNLATLRHMALNLLRTDTTKKRGVRGKQKIAGGDHRYLLKLLAI
jgi:predicted transposase YbfD/YdcC